MKNIIISIIIPAYNVQKHIEECIKSVEKQTYKNFEIIIINDGSIDNTKIICEKLQKEYKNIILINQKNAGVSASRNAGIDKAKGNYIMFIDSDDFIENNMLEKMIKNQNSDLIISNYKKYYSEKNIIYNTAVEEKLYSKKEILEDFWKLYNSSLINSPCFRLYKRNIIIDNSIKFDLNYELGEDLIFNLEYIDKCKSIKIVEDYLYNYRYSINSLTTKYREDYLEIQFKLINYIKKFLINNNKYDQKNQEELNKNICDIIVSSVQNLFLESSNLTQKETKNKLTEYLSLKEIELFKTVKYNQISLKIIKYLILRKRVNTIIIYSKIKEFLKGVIRKR